METVTASASINYFVNNIILNFNFQVFINLLLYSGAVATGILAASKMITFLFETLVNILTYRSTVRYKNRAEEIKELNNKMHDRLVEFEEDVKSNRYPADVTKRRLFYNAARFMKYDDTIFEDVTLLVNNWIVMLSLQERGEIKPCEISKVRSECITLVKKIRSKIDKVQP